jgi:hypothetical protein
MTMDSDPQHERRQAHACLDHLPDAQISEITADEMHAVEEALEWSRHNPGFTIPA